MSDSQMCLRIVLQQPDEILLTRALMVLDAGHTTYAIPRVWLDNANWEVLSDAEILTICREHLRHVILPPSRPPVTLGDSIRRLIASGNTCRLSKFYIRAANEVTQP